MDNVTRLLMQGAAGAGDKTYVDDVFSTYLWTGNGSNSAVRTMANGIDLAGEGGMVWIKNMDTANVEAKVVDTVRGLTGSSPYYLMPSETNAQGDRAWNWSFLNNGFSFNQDYADINGNGDGMSSWSFRKAKGFFDVVTYTGSGGQSSSPQTINHSLESIPGMIIIKNLDQSSQWFVYHVGIGEDKFLQLNKSDAAVGYNGGFKNITSSSVGVFDSQSTNGNEYVAYFFAGGASTATGASSCSFNGTSGLDVAASSDVNFGTGTFCVEAWVYVDNLPGSGSPSYARVFQLDGPTGNSNYNNLQVTINPSNQTLHAWAYGGGNPVAIVGSVSLLGQWHHIAVVRSNNVITQYVDGIADGNVNNSTDFSPNGGSPRPRIGSYDTGGTNGVFNGKISNVRLLVGTALYTGAFAIHEWPLTNITNTKLLCCQSETLTTVVGPTLSANNSPTVGTASGGFNTVVLACQDPDDATTEACGKTITIGDNAIHDSDHPF